MITTSTRDDIAQAWGVLHSALGLSDRIRDEEQYRNMSEFVESIVEFLPDNENEPLWGLVEIIADQIKKYEIRHYPSTEVSGADMLRFLMEQHGLKQSDLTVIGGQSVVSGILSGKRSLNVRQIRALSKRFGVSPAAFV